MKRSIARMPICWLIVFSLWVACSGPNLAMLKKQSQAKRNLAETYMSQGEFTPALKELLEAKALYADDPFLQYDLALTYMAKDRYDLAESHFQRALELNPNYAPAINGLGIAYLRQRKWDAAIGEFNKLTGDLLYATPHFPLSNLGLAYYHKKDFQRAIQYYHKALDIQPKFTIALAGLGRTCLADRQLAKAIEMLQQAVKLDDRFVEAWLDLARAYRVSYDYTAAEHAYGKVIDLAPNSDLARQAKDELARLENREIN